MNQHMLRVCAAVAITLSGQTAAQAYEDPVLQARVAVSWNASVQGLAKVLAERMALPYFDGSGDAAATVVLAQGEHSTVSQAIDAINAQIQPHHLALGLTGGADGQRLELARTQPHSTVAGITVNSAAVPTALEAPPAAVAASVATPATAPSPPQTTDLTSPAVPTELWQITPADLTLRSALSKWVDKAGWQLLWEAGSDVPIPVHATFEGDFRAAVIALFDTLSASEVSLNGLLYRGNKVLRVVETGLRTE